MTKKGKDERLIQIQRALLYFEDNIIFSLRGVVLFYECFIRLNKNVTPGQSFFNKITFQAYYTVSWYIHSVRNRRNKENNAMDISVKHFPLSGPFFLHIKTHLINGL